MDLVAFLQGIMIMGTSTKYMMLQYLAIMRRLCINVYVYRMVDFKSKQCGRDGKREQARGIRAKARFIQSTKINDDAVK